MSSTGPVIEVAVEADTRQTVRNDRLVLAIVIPSFNYADFVGQAIQSALAVDWPAKQIIVVDDGSTDASKAVIESYGSRITAIFQENAGQYQAYNAAFRQIQADVVIFLDSDDMLDPSVMREVATLWRPGLSKVQFRLRSIDAVGRLTGSVIPQFVGVPTPEEIRAWAAATATYPTPPGSGNAYATDYLAKIFPLDLSCGRPGDSSCIAAAPFLGDVLTLSKVLASYRIHGRNDGAASSLAPEQFRLHVERAHQRFEYTRRIARRIGIEIDDQAIDRSFHHLPYRLASLFLAGAAHPVPKDSALKVLRDIVKAMPVAQGVSLKAKLTIAIWAALVAALPDGAGRRLILWRFVPSTRPKAIRAALLRLGLVR